MADRSTQSNLSDAGDAPPDRLAALEQELHQLRDRLRHFQHVDQAQHDPEALYHSLVETLPVKIICKDHDGVFTFANRAFCEEIGRSLDQIVGRTDFDFYPAELAEKYQRDDRRVAETGQLFETVEENRRPDGVRQFVKVIKTPMRDAGGTYIGTQIIFWDVSAEERAKREMNRYAEALKRSNEALQEFAYFASHELQEPLRTMASFCQLLQNRYRGQLDDEADEFIGYVVEGADRMKRLIGALLEYARVGAAKLRHDTVDLNEIVNQAIANLDLTIQQREAQVTCDPLPHVYGDALQLTQLFQNLLSNAIKFCPDTTPQVHVTSSQRGEQWQLAVEDNGVGIDPKAAEMIFSPFKRLYGREAFPGSGIGLAICQKIVTRHGGRIWATSPSGPGTTFYFTLPDART